MVLLFYFDLNRRLEAFLKIANHSKLIGGPNKIRFCQNRLKVLKVKCLILGLFWLILRVFFKLTLDTINKGLETFKVFIEENFELKLYNQSSILIAAFVLSLSEANKATKNGDSKKNIIYLYCV